MRSLFGRMTERTGRLGSRMMVLGILGVVVLAVAAPAPSVAQGTITVRVQQASQAVPVNATFTVDIVADLGSEMAASGLGAYEFDLVDALGYTEFVSAEDAGDLGSTGRTVTVLGPDSASNGEMRAWFGAYSTPPDDVDGPKGDDVVLATVELQAKRAGIVTLELENVILADTEGTGWPDADTGRAVTAKSGKVWQIISAFFHLADFDGDGKADPAVWMNRNRFVWRESASGYDVASLWMGKSGDIPVVADYDGDGKMDLAIWRNSNRFIWLESSKDYATPAGSAWIGNPDAIPVPGDWDGDGKADPAVWTGNRFIWLESGSGYAVNSVWMGSPGDVPVPADYDGDGKMDPAIWRNNNQLIWLESSNDYATARSVWIGGPAAIPVPGDWDGDGKADPAVWTGNRFIWLESGSDYAVNSVWMGTPGDIPVPGDYDGDGKMDPAIWRNNNRFIWLESSNGYVPPAGSAWIGNDSSVPVP